jgi:hypothetical protein
MSFFRRYRFSRVDFHRHGNCWQLWRLPHRDLFFSGDVVEFSWWRVSVVFESRTHAEPY